MKNERLSILAMSLAVVVFVASSALADVLLSDDFNDGNADGWTELDGQFAVIDGVYHISANAPCNDARSTIGEPEWTDYTIDVDFMIGSSASHASVLFRIEEIDSGCDAGRYYQFHIFPTYVGFCRMDYSEGYCDRMIDEPASVPVEVWHHARLVVSGSEVWGYIDGKQVIYFDGLAHYPSGFVGLKNINSGTNRYDNVVVTDAGPVTTDGDSWGVLKALYW